MSTFVSRIGIPCLLAVLPLSAQSARLKLDQLNTLSAKASEVVDVTLDGSSLAMASKFMKDDPQAQALIKNLQGIYVKVFEFEKPEAYSSGDLESVRAQLQGWNRMVQVKSKKDGDVDVYLLGDGKGGSAGMTVVCADAKELVVVNIVGPIDLEKLSSLEGKMGIPKMDVAKSPRKGGAK